MAQSLLRLLPFRCCFVSSSPPPTAAAVFRFFRVPSSSRNKSALSQRHFLKHIMSSSASSDTSSKAAVAAAEGDPSARPPPEGGNGVGEENQSPDDFLVQYVVLRRDLIDAWPLGSVVTQGCHASVAAVWSNRDDHLTLDYCSARNLDSMHKVVLEVKGESQILSLSEKLKEGGIAHKLWIEQPENIPSCLATKPYPKSAVSTFFRRLKLCK